MGLLCIAVGLWAIHMGLEGRTPAKALSGREIPGIMAFGSLFAWGGIQTIILTWWGNKLPRWAHAVLISMFLVCLAVPFILIGILEHDNIQSSFSLNGLISSETTGGRSGGIVFVGVGILLLVSLPFLVKHMLPGKRKKAGQAKP